MEGNPVTFKNSPQAAEKILRVMSEIYAREKGVVMEIRRTNRKGEERRNERETGD